RAAVALLGGARVAEHLLDVAEVLLRAGGLPADARVVAALAQEALVEGGRLLQELPADLFHARLVGQPLVADAGQQRVDRGARLAEVLLGQRLLLLGPAALGLRLGLLALGRFPQLGLGGGPLGLPLRQDVAADAERHRGHRAYERQRGGGRAAAGPLGRLLP